MASFVNAINQILDRQSDIVNNETTTRTLCAESVNHYKFYQFALIPALLITLMFALTKKRRNLCLDVFHGRPGLIFPMDSLTRVNRISYSCAFGSMAYLVSRIVLEQYAAIHYEGHNSVETIIAIVSMFIYGMVFFPLFTSVAIGSVFGHAVGSVYVWMLTAIEIARMAECNTTAAVRVQLIFSHLPSFLCLLYLSISIPVRAVKAFWRRNYFYWEETFAETNTLKDIRESHSGHHVMDLFQKPKVKVLQEMPRGKKARVVYFLKTLVHRFIYKRKKGFRYPSRLYSVMLVSVIVIYTLTFQSMAAMQWFQKAFRGIRRKVELVKEQGTSPNPALLSVYLYFLEVIDILAICFYVACLLAALFALLNILHTLSSYRANLLALYKGDHSHIPPASAYSNARQCAFSMRYAGYQVGYNIWSYTVQLFLLWIIFSVIALLIKIDWFTELFVQLIDSVWPAILAAVIVLIVQVLMSKFVFLQDKGQVLALDNRAGFFNFTYFMFFYNIFLGLVSCLQRILKSIIVGTAFLCRLDSSTLPRRFEFIDPGFKAYVGYMHMEVAHTHPVLITFTRLMLLALQNKKEREADTAGVWKKNAVFDIELATNSAVDAAEVTLDEMGDHANRRPRKSLDSEKDEKVLRKRAAARFKWHLAYTLLRNMDIRVMRKGYIQMRRQAKVSGVAAPRLDGPDEVEVHHLQSNLQEAKEGRQGAYTRFDSQ